VRVFLKMNIQELKEKFDHLTSNGKSWQLEDIYVVAPYPTRDFFSSFLEIFHPTNKLFLFIDDGWPADRVEEIEEVIKNKKINSTINRISAQDGGFVHAKIYFFKWKNKNNIYMRHLLIGSANASSYGFGSHAETYALIWIGDLDAPENKKTFPLENTYFKKLADKNQCEQCDVGFASNSWISLPALKVVSKDHGGSAEAFDSWLRRGLLCHKYDPSANFGKIVLQANEPLRDSETMNAFVQAKLNEVSLTTQISYPYLRTSDRKGKNGANWKASYLIETIYGHWVSEECYRALGNTFTSGDNSIRKINIDKLKSGDKFENKINELIEKLNSVVNALGGKASKYLKTKDGRCDAKHYQTLATKKISNDRDLASDIHFKNRFVSGYSFTQAPSMSEADFNEFALSFCDEIIFEIGKPKSYSKIARILKPLIGDEKKNSSKALLNELRNNWGEYKSELREYWK